LYLAEVRFVTADLLLWRRPGGGYEGRCPFPFPGDRRSLAGASNTN